MPGQSRTGLGALKSPETLRPQGRSIPVTRREREQKGQPGNTGIQLRSVGRGAARASGGDHLRSLLQAPRRGGQWRPHDQPGWRPPPAQGLSQSPVPPDAQAWWVHNAPCRSKPARPATGRAGQAVSKSSGSPSWRPKEVAAMATSTLCRSREVRRFPAAPQPPGGGLNSGPRPSSVWHGEPLGSAGAPPHAAVPPPQRLQLATSPWVCRVEA